MKLSLSGFLFENDYSSQSICFGDFCAVARSAGYDGVELRRTQVNETTPRGERKELLGIVRDNGLIVTCLTARKLPREGEPRDSFFESYLELCADMACGLMKVGSDSAWLRGAAEKARKHGVALASNNHVGGDMETVAGAKEFLQAVGHPNYGLLYDPMHLMNRGQDYIGCIPDFLPFTRNILVQSDGQSLPDAPGVQDWPAILGRYKRLGYDGLITVIEHGWPEDRREHVAAYCSKFMRGTWEAS